MISQGPLESLLNDINVNQNMSTSACCFDSSLKAVALDYPTMFLKFHSFRCFSSFPIEFPTLSPVLKCCFIYMLFRSMHDIISSIDSQLKDIDLNQNKDYHYLLFWLLPESPESFPISHWIFQFPPSFVLFDITGSLWLPIHALV